MEGPAACAEGRPQLAGAYAGLHPAQWAALPEAYGDGRVAVLACECGEVGCWPLRVRIEASADTVTWADFAQPYRAEWSYAGLGPFVFDRREYDAAVASVAGEASGPDA